MVLQGLENMTEEAAPSNVKRRRLSAANTRLSDLPSGILAHAASFLEAPSRALFAVALNENSAVLLSDRRAAIVGNQWDTLDFGEIEMELAENLTDLDIEEVLRCINSVDNVKSLKLANCTNITGTCLETLRGSAVIEQIDLSLVGRESPDLDPEPPISCHLVLPILHSIIEREGCALKHLQFPSVWRKETSRDSEFHAFIKEYNQMCANRGAVHCLECNTNLQRNRAKWIGTATAGNNYGIQLHTCYGCLKHYCHGCDINGAKKFMMIECILCERHYCKCCMDMIDWKGGLCTEASSKSICVADGRCRRF